MSANEYTPTTEQVRFRYAEFPYVAEQEDDLGFDTESERFARWLATVVAEAKAEQWEADAKLADEFRLSFVSRLGDDWAIGYDDAAQDIAAAIRGASDE